MRSFRQCLRFGLRSLFLVTLLTAVFCAGFHLGYQRGHEDLWAETDTEAVLDELLELITSAISPDSWDEVGGPGKIEAFYSSRCFAVAQDESPDDPFDDSTTATANVNENDPFGGDPFGS